MSSQGNSSSRENERDESVARQSAQKNSKIFVGNLPSDVSENDVNELFQEFGQIRDLKLKNQGNGNIFAFIQFDDVRDAEKALQKYHRFEYKGKQMRIEYGHGGRTRNSNFQNKGCYICQQTDHLAKDCPMGSRPAAKNSCFTCGSSDHQMRFCPKNKNYSTQTGFAGNSRQSYSRSTSRSRSKDSYKRTDQRRRSSRSDSRERRSHHRDSRTDRRRERSYSNESDQYRDRHHNQRSRSRERDSRSPPRRTYNRRSKSRSKSGSQYNRRNRYNRERSRSRDEQRERERERDRNRDRERDRDHDRDRERDQGGRDRDRDRDRYQKYDSRGQSSERRRKY